MAIEIHYIDGAPPPILPPTKEEQEFMDKIWPLQDALYKKLVEDHRSFLEQAKKEGLKKIIPKLLWKLKDAAYGYTYKMYINGKKWDDYEFKLLELSKKEPSIFYFYFDYVHNILGDFLVR